MTHDLTLTERECSIRMKLRIVELTLHEDECTVRFWRQAERDPEQHITLRFWIFENRELVQRLLEIAGSDMDERWFELWLTRTDKP